MKTSRTGKLQWMDSHWTHPIRNRKRTPLLEMFRGTDLDTRNRLVKEMRLAPFRLDTGVFRVWLWITILEAQKFEIPLSCTPVLFWFWSPGALGWGWIWIKAFSTDLPWVFPCMSNQSVGEKLNVGIMTEKWYFSFLSSGQTRQKQNSEVKNFKKMLWNQTWSIDPYNQKKKTKTEDEGILGSIKHKVQCACCEMIFPPA